jgi:hypothetical protein
VYDDSVLSGSVEKLELVDEVGEVDEAFDRMGAKKQSER